MDYVRPGDAVTHLGKYLTKMQAGFELTRADLKQSRQAKDAGGRLPMDLIDAYALADDAERPEILARWREYETAMTGKSAVRFSKGLRSHLGMDAALTDEELAEAEVDGETEDVFLTAPLYRQLFTDGHAAAVITAHRIAGPPGVLRLVTGLYPGRTLAEEGQLPDPAVLLIGWVS
ncbi:MAG: hypothetical protein JHC71_13025 [Blastococcus sp.]|nr:hypothetical protein [Blastococcus sp.]